MCWQWLPFTVIDNKVLFKFYWNIFDEKSLRMDIFRHFVHILIPFVSFKAISNVFVLGYKIVLWRKNNKIIKAMIFEISSLKNNQCWNKTYFISFSPTFMDCKSIFTFITAALWVHAHFKGRTGNLSRFLVHSTSPSYPFVKMWNAIGIYYFANEFAVSLFCSEKNPLKFYHLQFSK